MSYKLNMTPLILLPTSMAVPVYVAEEVAVGRSVFQNFVHEEFEVEGVPDEIFEEVESAPNEILEEEIVEEDVTSDHMARAQGGDYDDENFANALDHVGASGFNTHMVTRQVGATIRELANEFAQSRERERLKVEADKVDVGSITYDGFFALCEEVFRQGITRENLIALFFFCADVLIKCVKTQMKDIGIRLFKWALKYIVERVCAWVAKHGGWEKAIQASLSKGGRLIVISAAAVGIFAVSGFILYKWSS